MGRLIKYELKKQQTSRNIILALLLNSNRTRMFKKSVPMVTYAPHFISVVVLVSLLNVFFGQSTGLVNNLREMLGLSRELYMGKPQYFRHMYVWSGIWQNMGWGILAEFATGSV